MLATSGTPTAKKTRAIASATIAGPRVSRRATRPMAARPARNPAWPIDVMEAIASSVAARCRPAAVNSTGTMLDAPRQTSRFPILVHLGVVNGRKSAAKATGASEIVALTVDSRSIDRLAGEVSGMGVAITELGAIARYLVKATELQAERTDCLTEALRDTTRGMQDLTAKWRRRGSSRSLPGSILKMS